MFAFLARNPQRQRRIRLAQDLDRAALDFAYRSFNRVRDASDRVVMIDIDELLARFRSEPRRLARDTASSRYAGTLLHATAISNILQGDYLHEVPPRG